MPPAPRFAAAAVLDAAFALVRRDGPAALSARTLAAALGASPQPIYRVFGTMAAVHDAVRARAWAHFLAAVLPADAPPGTYLAAGERVLAYLDAEPHLFALVTRDPTVIRALVDRAPLPPAVDAAMARYPELAGLDAAARRRLHTTLWFIAQGATVLLGVDARPAARRLVRQIGATSGAALIAAAASAPPESP